MILKADLHVHTTASDGRCNIDELISRAKKCGLDAMAICDHNMCTPLPETDFILIPATEISTNVGHVVGLYVTDIDFERLRANGIADAAAAVEQIHARNGLAVLAHPFEYKSAVKEKFDGIAFDFIETANSRAPMKIKNANELAVMYAQSRKLPQTGGSDAHGSDELGGSYTEIECDSALQLESALRQGKTRAVFVRRCRWIQKGKTRLNLSRKNPNPKKTAKSLVYFAYTLLREIFDF